MGRSHHHGNGTAVVVMWNQYVPGSFIALITFATPKQVVAKSVAESTFPIHGNLVGSNFEKFSFSEFTGHRNSPQGKALESLPKGWHFSADNETTWWIAIFRNAQLTTCYSSFSVQSQFSSKQSKHMVHSNSSQTFQSRFSSQLLSQLGSPHMLRATHFGVQACAGCAYLILASLSTKGSESQRRFFFEMHWYSWS